MKLKSQNIIKQYFIGNYLILKLLKYKKNIILSDTAELRRKINSYANKDLADSIYNKYSNIDSLKNLPKLQIPQDTLLGYDIQKLNKELSDAQNEYNKANKKINKLI
jgi:hypothetical protein